MQVYNRHMHLRALLVSMICTTVISGESPCGQRVSSFNQGSARNGLLWARSFRNPCYSCRPRARPVEISGCCPTYCDIDNVCSRQSWRTPREYISATFVQRISCRHMQIMSALYNVSSNQGFDYSRCGNPSRSCFEACMAALDGAKHCKFAAWRCAI